jgi:hypothetical protein
MHGAELLLVVTGMMAIAFFVAFKMRDPGKSGLLK